MLLLQLLLLVRLLLHLVLLLLVLMLMHEQQRGRWGRIVLRQQRGGRRPRMAGHAERQAVCIQGQQG